MREFPYIIGNFIFLLTGTILTFTELNIKQDISLQSGKNLEQTNFDKFFSKGFLIVEETEEEEELIIGILHHINRRAGECYSLENRHHTRNCEKPELNGPPPDERFFLSNL